MSDKITEDNIKDFIRTGMKSSDLTGDLISNLKTVIGWTDDEIKMLKRMLKEFEAGDLLVICTEDDKKRIIKRKIDALIKSGSTPEEARDEINQDIDDGTLKFIK